jgi:hypothetical protein
VLGRFGAWCFNSLTHPLLTLMKRTPAISANRIRLARQQRFNPLRGLNPESLTAALDEFRVGNLRRAALIWDAMMNRDAVLKSVIPKRLKAVARCQWEVLTSDATSRALEHAAALRWFYNNLKVTSACDPNEQGGFSLLVRQMLTAIAMKYAVHEIILKPCRMQVGQDSTRSAVQFNCSSISPSAPSQDTSKLHESNDSSDSSSSRFTTNVTAELRFAPLWWFENRNGPLAYLKNDWDYSGEPLNPNEWLVTTGDGLMECCSVAYVFKTLSLQDWVGFNEKFGFPWIDAATDQPQDSEAWETLRKMVANFMNDGGMVRSLSGTEVHLVESKQTGGHVPFEPMVERMDRYNAAVWRGGEHRGARTVACKALVSPVSLGPLFCFPRAVFRLISVPFRKVPQAGRVISPTASRRSGLMPSRNCLLRWNLRSQIPNSKSPQATCLVLKSASASTTSASPCRTICFSNVAKAWVR